jgi:hypothetical protein
LEIQGTNLGDVFLSSPSRFRSAHQVYGLSFGLREFVVGLDDQLHELFPERKEKGK